MADGVQLPDELQWKPEKELRLAQDKTEELAVKVVADHQTLTIGKKIIVYVAGDQNEALVAVIENISDDDNTFSPKKVERYLIRSGRIHASMGPSIEPFPDVAFERSVIAAAKNALSDGGLSIMVVLDWSQPVSLKGIPHGRCNVEIVGNKIEAGGTGDELFRKTINCCRPDQVQKAVGIH